MKDRKWIALCAIGLVVLVLMNLPDAASSRMKGVVRDGVSPLQAMIRGGWREVREAFRYIRGIGDLALENRSLSEEIVYLRGEMRLARDLERENQLLREQLGFIARPMSRQLIPCEVIGRDGTGWWATVRLNKGRNAGVTEGRAVITTDGLIGRTVSVSQKTADVLLLSDPSCKVSIRLDRTGVFGILEGIGGKPGEQPACRIDYILKTADVQVGDEVVTAGMGGLFPKGLLVGHVTAVEMAESGLYQTAWVESAARLGEVEYAFVSAAPSDLADVRTASVADAAREPSPWDEPAAVDSLPRNFPLDVPELEDEDLP